MTVNTGTDTVFVIDSSSDQVAHAISVGKQPYEVNFTNETDRYIEQFGVQLTERELRQLRR